MNEHALDREARLVETSEMPFRGLTQEEVQRRRARGEFNRTTLSTSRPITDILQGNILTLFNGILAAAVVLLLLYDQFRDAFLTGSLILFSVGVSTTQEIRAKLRLERIALLARLRVRVIRDGREIRIPQEDLVLGDYLVLSRGEPVVVDAIRATAVVATLVPQGLLLMSTVAYSVGAVRSEPFASLSPACWSNS
jgi:cation-transporting P-type ATPase E